MKPAKTAFISITIFSMLFLYAPFCLSAPNEINFQGRLLDNSGSPVTDGNYFMHFAIYDGEDSGSALWAEYHDAIPVVAGIYNVVLGTGTTVDFSLDFDAALFSGEERWLEISVQSETLAPRLKISSAAYALQAQLAERVADDSIVTNMLQDQVVDQAKLADNAVSSAKIQDSSITNDDIAPGLDADTVDSYEGASLEESSEIDADIASHTSVTSAHHTKTTSFSELTDSATDAQVPNNITINEATNADTVDHQHASAFADASHDHSSLNAADGLPLNAVSVDSGGSVGIGTTSPHEKLHVSGSSDPRIMIEATDTSNPELNLKSSGTNDWAIYKNGSSGDLRFYQLGDKVTIEGGTGNVGIGVNNPEQKLHVNGLAKFELGSGEMYLTTPGARPGVIVFHNDGTRSDMVFHDDGIYIAKSIDTNMPSIDGGIMIMETGNVGIGTANPVSQLEVKGEIRTTSSAGVSRLWGQGRPGTVRYGIHGQELGLCTNGLTTYGLSNTIVNWGDAASACPAGTWVCTAEERGTYPCNTSRPITGGDGFECDGTSISFLLYVVSVGWVADTGPGLEKKGVSVDETGDEDNNYTCESLPVWCCSGQN